MALKATQIEADPLEVVSQLLVTQRFFGLDRFAFLPARVVADRGQAGGEEAAVEVGGRGPRPEARRRNQVC